MEEKINQNRLSMYKGPERRRYKRIRKHFITKFRIRPKKALKGASADWNLVTTQNFGAGGILLNYNKEIAIDSIIDLVVNFPPTKDLIACVGKVIRIEQPPHSLVIHIAATFIEIDKQKKETIHRAAEEFYSRKFQQIEP